MMESVRIRVRINGTATGKPLKIGLEHGISTTEEVATAAAAKLLASEQAANVSAAAVKLYLKLGDELKLGEQPSSSETASQKGLADDASTIQSGECWVVLLGEMRIGVATIISATKSLKGGLHAEGVRSRPHLLKDVASVAVNIFGVVAGSGSALFVRSQCEFFRASRRLMIKLAKGDEVDLSRVAEEGVIKLTSAGVQQLVRAVDAAPALWASLR